VVAADGAEAVRRSAERYLSFALDDAGPERAADDA
jgi:hypothetical protein